MNTEIQTIQVPTKELKFADYNPRVWSKKAKANLTDSIKKYGFIDPIIVNSAPTRKDIIIGGHFRVHVAKEMGITTVPVIYVHIPDIEKEKELNLRLNKNTGDWSMELLAQFDKDFLSNIGFEEDMLSNLFPKEIKEDEAPDPPDEPKSKIGDLYQLGNHRLLCGDATKREDVERLMDGQKANMCFTDPPYNVNYQGGMYGDGRQSKREKIKNDNMSSKQFYEFLFSVMENLISVVDGAFYVCMSSSELHNLWKAFTDAGGHWQTYIIWAKDSFTLSRTDYQHQYEPIMHGLTESEINRAFNEVDEDKLPIMYGWTKHEWWGGAQTR